MRTPSKVLLYLVAGIMAAACFVAPDQSDPVTPPAATGDQPDGTDTVEEFQSDVQVAVSLAEEYWSEAFGRSGQQFVRVRRVIAYEESGELDCAVEPIPANNAVYCPASDFIAYDADWAFGAFRQIGDAFIYFLLGHEYAHAIQARLGVEHEFTIEHELQADCMAGAYLGDSVRARRLSLGAGDLEEFQRGLIAVGDEPGQPWFAEGSHGSPEQRIDAFGDGYDGSLAACGLE